MSGLFDQVVNYSPPLLTAGQVNYDGTWNAATNTPTLLNPPDALSKGDYYVVSAAGTFASLTFAVGDWIISNGTAWEKVDLTDAVSSVFGRTGAVVGDSTDYSAVGLTNTAIGAANPSTGAFTSLSSSSTTTLNGTTIPASKTLVVTTDKLSALAATTSAELAGVISDETGSGSLVFANSPTLVTPALGTPSALVGTNITGTAAAFNINGTVGATTPSTVAATSVTALSDSGYQAVVGQLTSGDRVGISGQASGIGTALVFFDNAQTTFRPAIFDASSHSLKISGVEKASVTSTGLQGAIGATTPSTGAFTSLSSTSGAFNGTVGATTPSTIAATTGGFSGAITSTKTTGDVLVLGSGITTGTEAPSIDFNGGSGTNGGPFIRFKRNSVAKGYLGIESGLNGGTSDDISLYGVANTRIYASNAQVATFTSTGLNNTAIGATTPSTGAFTTLSTSGNATLGDVPSTDTHTVNGITTINFDLNGVGKLVLNNQNVGAASSSALVFGDTGTERWKWASYRDGTGQIRLSIVGGSDILNISSTGLAVTGALSCTGALAIGNTVNTVSPTSPNRTVTIVIGGTTYYLAAKTTND